jgi:hypothetical protein
LQDVDHGNTDSDANTNSDANSDANADANANADAATRTDLHGWQLVWLPNSRRYQSHQWSA